jgi:hypothetical protein
MKKILPTTRNDDIPRRNKRQKYPLKESVGVLMMLKE